MASLEGSMKQRPWLDEFFKNVWSLDTQDVKEAYERLKNIAEERQIYISRRKEELENDLHHLDAASLQHMFTIIKVIASGKKIDLNEAGTRGAHTVYTMNPLYEEPKTTYSPGIPSMDQATSIVQQLPNNDLYQLYMNMKLMLTERGIIIDETNQNTAIECSGHSPMDTGVKTTRTHKDDRHYTEEEYRHKIATLEKQVDDLSKSKKKYKDEKESFKKRCAAEVEQKLEEAENHCQILRQNANHNIQLKQERIDKLEIEEAKYRNKIKSLEDEKSELLRRLSVIAGAKLSDNNPNLTDLSDMNRPQKIGEKYSDLYDNEWTDAFEYLEERKEESMKAIIKLLNTFEDCFQFCQQHASRNLELLLSAACNPLWHLSPTDTSAMPVISRDECSPEVSQRIVDMRKATAKLAIPLIKQEYYKKLKEFEGVKIVKGGDRIQKYVDKCVEICWYANVQDPPLVLTTDFPPYSPYDSNVTRNYTKSGKFVDYVVWPALLLHDNGPLLSKGVVQCTNTAKGEVKEKNADKVPRIKRKNSQDNQID